jgi:hypothetical protein
MKSPPDKQNGMVAILDALGAASYGDQEIQTFLESRRKVLDLLDAKIEGKGNIVESTNIDVFTFNDTVLISYKTNQRPPDLLHIEHFFRILRKFFVDSLSNKILFRGAVAIGTFYVHDQSNTVMGQAVTDAAAWYDKADWIGIQLTPKGSITVQHLLEKKTTKGHFILDYDVPLKDAKTIRVKAVNWPRVFFVSGITPCAVGEKPREKLLELLSKHSIPLGTEKKFLNTIAFFDFVRDRIKAAENKTRPKIRFR